MKKIDIYSALSLMAILCFAGCSDDDTYQSTTDTADNTLFISATVDLDDMPKIKVGDKLGLYVVNNSDGTCVVDSYGGASFSVESIQGGVASLKARVYYKEAGSYTIYPYSNYSNKQTNWVDNFQVRENRLIAIDVPESQMSSNGAVVETITELFAPIEVNASRSNVNVGKLDMVEATQSMTINMNLEAEYDSGTIAGMIKPEDEILSVQIISSNAPIAGAATYAFGTVEYPEPTLYMSADKNKIDVAFPAGSAPTLGNAQIAFTTHRDAPIVRSSGVEPLVVARIITDEYTLQTNEMKFSELVTDGAVDIENVFKVDESNVSNLTDATVSCFSFDSSVTMNSAGLNASSLGVDLVVGKYGKAAKFSDITWYANPMPEYFEIEGADLTKDHGVSFWVKMNPADGRHNEGYIVVSASDVRYNASGVTFPAMGSSNPNYDLVVAADTKNKNNGLMVANRWPSHPDREAGGKYPFSIVDNTWHHVYISSEYQLDGTLSISTYVDNRFIHTEEGCPAQTADHRYGFGFRGASDILWLCTFVGEIDDVRIFNAPLTELARLKLYNDETQGGSEEVTTDTESGSGDVDLPGFNEEKFN